MKVCLIGPVYPYRGGIAHYTTQLALSMRSQGHTCTVISFRRQYPEWLYPGGTDKDPSQSAIRVDAEFLIDPFNPFTWSQTAKFIRKQSPDLLVLPWWTTYWAMPFASITRHTRRYHLPVVYLVHNVIPHEEKFWDRWMVKFALAPADGFIVQTPRERERLLSLLPKAITELSPHPTYSMLTKQRVDKALARQSLGLPLDRPLLLFFGIVRPYKGLKYLIEALSLLKTRGVTPTLLVAGDFWHDRSLYEKQIEAYGLAEQVKLDDRYIPDEDAALMFSAADVLVAPYTGGTQSGVAGLALGFGLPIITSALVSAGLSEAASENLWVVPAEDAGALADAIGAFLEKPVNHRTNELGTQDNWWKMVAAIERLYEQVRPRV